MSFWSFGNRSSYIVFVLALLLLAVVISTDYMDEDVEQPDIYFISIETFPAERMSCMGYERATTENLCDFAENASVYERAYAPAAYTPLTFASWKTGKYPFQVGIYHHDSYLSGDYTLLQEEVSDQGYNTYINPFHQHLPEEKGFLRGFDSEFDRENLSGIIENSEEPVYIRDHIVEPHDPYVPDKRYMEQDMNKYIDEIDENTNAKVSEGIHNPEVYKNMTEEETRYINDAYDDTLRSVDKIILPEIFEQIKESGDWENSLIIITADHGEMLGREGLYHHLGPYEQNMRVPLIIKEPEQEDSRKYQDIVSLKDLNDFITSWTGGRGQERLQETSEALVQDTYMITGVNGTHKFTNCLSPQLWCQNSEMMFEYVDGEDVLVDTELEQNSTLSSTVYEKWSKRVEEQKYEASDEHLDALQDLGYLE